jgi:hypothetical protein
VFSLLRRDKSAVDLLTALASFLWFLVSLVGLAVLFPAYVAVGIGVAFLAPMLRRLILWDITQTQRLHRRLSSVRRALFLLVLIQWLLLLLLGVITGMACLEQWPMGLLGAEVVGMILLLLFFSLLAGAASGYYSELLMAWRAYPVSLCPDCGYVRGHSPGDRCPECGSDRPVPKPGQTPRLWEIEDLLGNGFAVHAPVGLLALACLIVGFLVDSMHAADPRVGTGLILVTVVVGVLAMRTCLKAYLILRATRPLRVTD